MTGKTTGRTPDMIDVSLARVLAVPTRVEMFRLLRAAARPLSAAELAAATGRHVNTVRCHLEQLVEAGLVTRVAEPPNGPGRPTIGYEAAGAPVNMPSGGGAGAAALRPQPHQALGYFDLAEALVAELATGTDPARDPAGVGRRWARRLGPEPGPSVPSGSPDPTTRMVELLRGMGFEPTTEPLGDRIYLHGCPFAELARRHPGVVCAIHRGFLGEILDRVAAPLAIAGVDPFVRDGLCLVRLATQSRRPSAGEPRPAGAPSAPVQRTSRGSA